MIIRPPAVAGTFYPYEKRELKEMVNSFLDSAKRTHIDGNLKALIVPHAGYIYSGPVAAVGYKLLRDNNPNTEQLFLIGQSHMGRFMGVAQGEYDFWETPLGKVQIEQLNETSIIRNNSRIHEKEHSLEVQLPFLQTILKKFSCYGLLMGETNPAMFAMELIKEVKDESVIIVSSDLSHYHPYNQAVRIDSVANKAIPLFDFNKVENFVEACGKDAILTLMHIAKLKKWSCELLDYKNSGDTSGSKDQVVGYGCYAFYE